MLHFTHEERLDIIGRSLVAAEEGKDEESQKIIQQIPLAPHIAKAAKDVMGVEYLINSGFDLSRAEAKYGKNWLNQ